MVPNGLSESTGCAVVKDLLEAVLWSGRHRIGMAGIAAGSTRVVDYIGELRTLASRAFPSWSEFKEQREVLIRNHASLSMVSRPLLSKCSL